MVVASTTDPLVTIERAQGFAADWGSDFKLAGDAGHINAASGHGPWPEGLLMFGELMKRLKA
jgi:predicted alpha/beta hydrolase family esterase